MTEGWGGFVWRVRASTVALGGRRYRVVRPAEPAGHAPMYLTWLGAQLTVDAAGLAELAAAWWLATRSRRTLVHLPLRRASRTCGRPDGSPALDLVLLHHSLAFRASRWRELRRRAGSGRPGRVRVPAAALPSFGAEWHERFARRECRDRLDHAEAAGTLFLTGSRPAFERHAERLRILIGEASAPAASTAVSAARHACAEIEHTGGTLHVELCTEHGT